ncbi:hypothetical protein ACFOU2_15950 [Bacillus songklensis]|uniref:Uracil-DNA glycosylase n=1 Tax=Bacillus songklensis TaxID=1069116 RepID=A0ABV8B6R8_9BACI
MKRFHCCATCIHFKPVKTERGMTYFCSRLGYETDPKYQFNCWSPTETVRKLIEKEKGKG